ncbi:unnamed protein product [Arabidopsis halleri]
MIKTQNISKSPMIKVKKRKQSKRMMSRYISNGYVKPSEDNNDIEDYVNGVLNQFITKQDQTTF